MMDTLRHRENIYGKKAADAVSWYHPHLEISLELIERAAPEYSASIIDIGGGESTLVDDLLARGYRNISVLDISQTAVDANKKRLDDRLRLTLYRVIYGYPALEKYALGVQKPIRIIVKNGRVTLEGVVDNEADKNLAGLRANGVPGIFSVTNNLQVVPA
jgi:BON domain